MTKTILFVCQGNSIRSIIAEAAFNHFCRKNYIAKSAGTLPIHRIDDKTRQVLKEEKIQLNKEVPTPLKYEEIASAYRLVLMNENIPNFPVMIPKEMIIQWQIGEVVGKPIEEFRKARDHIISNVKELIKKLK
jgi:arsenate reductase